MQKSVTFGTASAESEASNTAAALPLKKRRSSIKAFVSPLPQASGSYSHPDPLLRRLRIQNPQGKPCSLIDAFPPDITLVAFIFGAAPTNSKEQALYVSVNRFAERFNNRIRSVYVSVDQSEKDYNSVAQNQYSLIWNDGSNFPSESDTAPSTPTEPFLLATDRDLEENLDTHNHDTYLRPYSRVFLAERWQIFGVPQLLIYNVAKRSIVTRNARFPKLDLDHNDGLDAEKLVDDWEQGQSGDYGFTDVFYAARWSIGVSVAALSYMVAVQYGGVDDGIGKLGSALIKSMSGQQ